MNISKMLESQGMRTMDFGHVSLAANMNIFIFSYATIDSRQHPHEVNAIDVQVLMRSESTVPSSLNRAGQMLRLPVRPLLDRERTGF